MESWMNPSTANWPCPACAEVIPADYESCPHCRLSADWLDLLRALDFAIRRFLLWKLEGEVGPEQYRAVLEACGRQLDRLVRLAQDGQPVPSDTGLPPRCSCWRCEQTCHPSAHYCPDCSAPLHTSEVRLLRYQQFLACEIQRQQQGGRLTEEEARRLLADVPQQLSELRGRLDRGRFLVSSR
jgi:hypothetical protein